MKIAIMQPYLFPYIGYFQLINAVDTFVFYDDVNFIKGGWINRNNILTNKKSTLFTVSLDSPSSFSLISETKIDLKKIDSFSTKFLKTISQSYKKAPFYEEVFPMLEVFFLLKKRLFISEMAIDSIVMISEYLGINTKFQRSSINHSATKELEKADRLISIAEKEGATTYINPIGGMELYSKKFFATNNIELHFIKADDIEYSQFKNDFVPWLSIIDVLMFNSKEDMQLLLNKFTLV